MKKVLTRRKGRSSTEEPRDEEDTTVIEPDQNNGTPVTKMLLGLQEIDGNSALTYYIPATARRRLVQDNPAYFYPRREIDAGKDNEVRRDSRFGRTWLKRTALWHIPRGC